MVTSLKKNIKQANAKTAHLKNKHMIKLKRTGMGNKGQSIIEYIILTSLIGIISIVAVKNLGGVIQRRINLIKEEIVRIIPND